MTDNTNHPEFRTDLSIIMQAILDSKQKYLESRAEIAQLSIESFYHAAQFGNCSALNALFAMVSINDKLSFKAWARKASTFIDNDTKKERTWLKFSEDKHFQVLKGVEAYRQGQYSVADLMALTPFYDVEKKARQTLELAEKKDKAIQASLDNLKTIAGRMDEYNIVAPLEVNNALALVQDFFKDIKNIGGTQPVQEETTTPETTLVPTETVQDEVTLTVEELEAPASDIRAKGRKAA